MSAAQIFFRPNLHTANNGPVTPSPWTDLVLPQPLVMAVLGTTVVLGCCMYGSLRHRGLRCADPESDSPVVYRKRVFTWPLEFLRCGTMTASSTVNILFLLSLRDNQEVEFFFANLGLIISSVLVYVFVVARAIRESGERSIAAIAVNAFTVTASCIYFGTAFPFVDEMTARQWSLLEQSMPSTEMILLVASFKDIGLAFIAVAHMMMAGSSTLSGVVAITKLLAVTLEVATIGTLI